MLWVSPGEEPYPVDPLYGLVIVSDPRGAGGVVPAGGSGRGDDAAGRRHRAVRRRGQGGAARRPAGDAGRARGDGLGVAGLDVAGLDVTGVRRRRIDVVGAVAV